MSMRRSDLVLFAGGECLERHGVLVKRTAPSEDVSETFARTGGGVYVARGGLLKRATDNVPRVTYLDLDGASEWTDPALLLEAARSNLLLRSEEFDHAAWVKTDSTITPNASTGPDGTVSGDRIAEGTAGTASVEQSITVGAGATVAVSRHVAYSNHAWLRMGMYNGGDSVQVWFNLTTKTVGGSTVGGAGVFARAYVETLGAGWLRCVVVGSLPGSTSYTCFSASADADQSVARVASSTRDEFGAQAEVGAFASSYIKTVGAAAVRNVEDFATAFPWRPQAMTGYVKFVERGTILTPGVRVLQLGDGATLPTLIVYAPGATGYRVEHNNNSGGAAAFSTVTTKPSVGDLVELRFTLASDGSVRIHQSINEAAEESGTASAAHALTAAWSGQLLYINGRFGGNSAGFNAFRALKVALGSYSMDEMRGAA